MSNFTLGPKKLSNQQVGKAGELLVQLKLLLRGVESAPLTTDSGVDLVAYSSRNGQAKTIQVKTNLKAKPGGGKGKLALDWWFPVTHNSELYALVDLESERVWLFASKEAERVAQQRTAEKCHLYMYVDPTVKSSKGDRPIFTYQFEQYLLENSVHDHF